MSNDDGGPGRGVPRLRRTRPLAGKRQRNEPAVTRGERQQDGDALVTWTEANPVRVILEMRAKRKKRLLKQLGLFCGLPALIAFFYMLVFASPRYITEFEITYQTYQPPQTASSGLVQSFLGSMTGNAVDLSSILYEYIRSPALLVKLDRELHLRKHYSSPDVDFLSRMSSGASLATFLRTYRWNVSVAQGDGGYLTVRVTSYDQKYTYALAQAIIAASDKMIDGMTAKARQNEVRSARLSVKSAEDRVRSASQALAQFQNAHGDLNPGGSAQQIGGIVGTLEANLSARRAALSELMSTAPGSPQVYAVKRQIAALEGQLKQEQQRLANDTGQASYARLLEKYSSLQLEQEFAKAAYLTAQQGLSTAEASAATKQSYLIDFAPPYAPDKENLRLAFYYALTVLMSTLVLFGVGNLMRGALRDQLDL